MNLQEYHREFKIASDKVDSLQYAEFTKAERLQFLNEAVLSFVKTRYSKNNLYKEGFEEVQKRRDDLRALVKINTLLGGIESIEFGKSYKDFDFPIDYMFYLKSHSIVQYNKKVNCVMQVATAQVTNSLEQIDDFNKIILDPFAEDLTLYYVNNKIRAYYSKQGVNYTVTGIVLTYLKLPIVYSIADLDSVVIELSEHTHKEIVGLSVLIAQSYIQNTKGIEIQQNILNKIE